MRVEDTVGFITGGASGLGEATARMLMEGGGRVIIFDRERSPGAAVAHSLGKGAVFVAGDVSEPEAVEAAVGVTLEQFGRLDVTVNCAAISPVRPILTDDDEMHPLDLFRRAIDVNLIGLFDVVRWSALLMSRNAPTPDGERGLIINVASVAGIDGQAGQSAYVASKGAVIALTLQLARDLADRGIRVMSIAPGMMDTAMLAGIDDERRQSLIEHHVFPRRLGRPREFAQLVRTLMEVSLFNGEVVRLDAAARLGPR
jgi:3-hydroxyacyl-CoA dehydrogenase/3-hydroxy-2-methylbutyryl-CoA dehydrogenase